MPFRDIEAEGVEDIEEYRDIEDGSTTTSSA